MVGLSVALFSYAVNKPIAVMVEESVEVLVRAGNDMSELTEEEKEMPLIQVLAYCKPAEEGDDSSGFDLSFAADLADMISGQESGGSGTTPEAVRLSIEAATQTMSGLMLYFQSSPSLSLAMGLGVELLPIVNHVFDAVRNVISIIDCGVAFTFFENMIDVLDEHAVPSFKSIAAAEYSICALLVAVFALSRFTAYVLDRPRKLWHCEETGRWFRFRAAYNAHVALNKRKKRSGTAVVGAAAKKLARALTPAFSCVDIALTIAAVFHMTLFVMIPNAFMAMGGSGFRGVPAYVPFAMLATSVVGLASTWTPSKTKISAAGAIVAVILALVTSLTCVLAMAVQADNTFTCYTVVSEAMEAVRVADAEGEDVSYAEALVEAQESEGLSCSFTDIADYTQSMIFCLVNFLMTLVCFAAGSAYLCSRGHMVTDGVRKTMLKVSAAGTEDGRRNNLIESLGGTRTDGLGNKSGLAKFSVDVRRMKGTWQFKAAVVACCGVAAAGAAWVMKRAGDTANGSVTTLADWEFATCSGVGCCNGLASNCGRRINEVTFAGIHNSMSNGEDGWLTPNHRLPHLGALEAGYRALLNDVYMHDGDFDGPEEDSLYVCHGLCSFGKRKASEDFGITKRWLDENPNEIIQIFFENPDGALGDDALWSEFELLGMNDMLIVRDGDGLWPTMGEAIEGGKRIMLMKFAGCDPNAATEEGRTITPTDGYYGTGRPAYPCPEGYHKGFEVGYDTPYHLSTSHDMYKTVDNVHGGECVDDPCTYSANVQLRPANAVGFTEGGFFMVNHFLTPPIAAFALEMNAEDLIKDRIEALEDVMCVRVGQIAIDFWSVGSLGPVKAAQWNNKRPLPDCVKTAVHADQGGPYSVKDEDGVETYMSEGYQE